ncbi:MAG: PilZ domain-containing protein [Phycisphaerales bacterium]|nr:MAG: PilZ domain-containing protein [Phycisphaerales bacterium]
MAQWLAEALATGTTDHYTGKRRHPRTTWNAELQVRVLSDGRAHDVRYVTARDVSRGGLGFFCRTSIAPFTSIEVARNDRQAGVAAVVMHCTQSLGGYCIGAEFQIERIEPSTAAPPDAD